MAAAALGSETLYRVIGAVARGPDLDRVLPAVVDLLVDATSCHACFVYLREGERLVMRAASPVFAHAVGRVVLGMDEGLCGWVARHRTPAFIRDRAFEDSRMKYVPELEEERFQSMVAVPLLDNDADVIGVVVLHTEAPREFGQDVLDFLEHVASLVAGAIANAQLYDATRRQVGALEALVALGQRLAALGTREELLGAVRDGVPALLACDACAVMAPGDAPPADGAGVLREPLVAGDRRLGLLVARRDAPFGPDAAPLLAAVAGQLAVALEKAELIARLTEEHRVRDLFDALAENRVESAAAHARAAGVDATRRYVVVVADAASAAVEAGLRRLAPGALCDLVEGRVRALLPVDPALRGAEGSAGAGVRGGVPDGAGAAAHGGGPGAEHPLRTLDAALDRLGREIGMAVGRSEVRAGATDPRGLAEATTAARIAAALAPDGGARSYAGLGVYRYLAPLEGAPAPDERHARAVHALAEYDARRRTALTATLERHLAGRDGVAGTARALFVHPNTLRQRLARIEELTGLDLASEDLLSLELALKLARLA